MSIEVANLHGHEVVHRVEGSGPVVLLVHGIAGSRLAWESIVGRLALDHTVIAPDLPGHGESGLSAGDYSVGALAATLRDLLLWRGHESATLVGHSLGGGVAMQFSYLFPEHTERLVLVSSGGLGRSVNPWLRSAALPGAEVVVAGIGLGARAVSPLLGGAMSLAGRPASEQLEELGRSLRSLGTGPTRRAFLDTLRAVVGPDGQRVFAGDRLYLAAEMPTLIVWGSNDPVIPVGHGRRAHAAMQGSELVVLEGVGHFPALQDPDGLTAAILEFLARVSASTMSPARWRALLRDGPPPHGG